MIKRSISMPVKPEEEKQKHLKRCDEIEELHEDIDKNLFEYNSDDFCDNSIDDITKKTDQNYDTSSENEKGSENDFLIEKKKFARVIDKSGRRNVILSNIPKKSIRFFTDFVTTLIEQQWRYTLTVFIGSFILSWIIFTMLWYLIAYAHGDLQFDQNGQRLGDGHQPCIIGATTLTGIFIHSVEAQTTIGFGEKYPSDECPEGIFLFVAQLIISVALEGAMVGIIYSKISRPVKYVSKYKFSKNAVICDRDGKLCFVFRVCDPKEHQVIDTKISVYMLIDTRTTEGELLIKTRKELKISEGKSPIIIWPETICHVIDENSPLFNCIENNKFVKQFEIFVSLVGSSPSMDQMTESKTSYLPYEIIWDHCFTNIIMYDSVKENYFIDYINFNTIVPMKDIKFM